MKKYIIATIFISILLNLKLSFVRGYCINGGTYPRGGECLLVLLPIFINLALKQKDEFLAILKK